MYRISFNKPTRRDCHNFDLQRVIIIIHYSPQYALSRFENYDDDASN